MKLVEIKDVRVGQVWKNSHWDIALIKKSNSEHIELHQWNYDIPSEQDYNTTPNYITENACNWKLVGKLGITHKIEDNRLVEIKRDEDNYVGLIMKDEKGKLFCVLDIEEFYYDDDCDVVCYTMSEDGKVYTRGECLISRCENCGIYGVTHEFVNDSEG